jgi:hypothetical protein
MTDPRTYFSATDTTGTLHKSLVFARQPPSGRTEIRLWRINGAVFAKGVKVTVEATEVAWRVWA